MNERLDKIMAKVDRAEKHIDELKVAIKSFHDSEPYGIRGQIDPDTNILTAYLEKADPVPINIGLIVGDVLSNLRDALDHLAYQLLHNENTTDPRLFERCAFPTAKSKAAFDRIVKDNKPLGVGDEAKNAMYAVCAYPGGNNDLGILHMLNNINKHRLIVATGLRGMEYIIPGVLAYDPAINGFVHSRPAIPSISDFPNVNDEVFTTDFFPDDCEYAGIGFTVTFNEPEVITGKPVLETLNRIHGTVKSTIVSFKKYLD